MGALELKETLLGTDIIRIINKGCGLEGNFFLEVTLFTYPTPSGFDDIGDVESIKLDKLLRIDIQRGFADSISDSFLIYATMPAGTYVKYLLSRRELIEADLKFKLLDEDGEIVEFTWRMRVFLAGIEDKAMSDQKLNLMTVEELNNIGMINVCFQMVYRELEMFRGGSVSTSFKDINVEDAMFIALGSWLKESKPKIDGAEPSIVFKFQKPNERTSERIIDDFNGCNVVADGVVRQPYITEFPRILQERFGVYDSGLNCYLFKPMKKDVNNEEKDIVFCVHKLVPDVFRDKDTDMSAKISLYTKNVDKAKASYKEIGGREVVILSSFNQTVIENNLYTFGKDGDILYVIPGSNLSSSTKNDENSIQTATATFIAAPGAEAVRSGLKIEDGKAIIDNKENIKQINGSPGKKGNTKKVNIIKTTDSTVSVENMVASSHCASAVSFSMTWRFGNPFIIRPYDVITLKFVDKNDNLIEYTGAITNMYFTHDFTRSSSSVFLTFTGYPTDYIKGEV